MWATSGTYTTAHGNAKSLTHWTRPGIEPESLWILVGLITCWATAESDTREQHCVLMNHHDDGLWCPSSLSVSATQCEVAMKLLFKTYVSLKCLSCGCLSLCFVGIIPMPSALWEVSRFLLCWWLPFCPNMIALPTNLLIFLFGDSSFKMSHSWHFGRQKWTVAKRPCFGIRSIWGQIPYLQVISCIIMGRSLKNFFFWSSRRGAVVNESN